MTEDPDEPSPQGWKELGMAEPLSTGAYNVAIFPEKEGTQINKKLCKNNTKSFLIKQIFYLIKIFYFILGQSWLKTVW